MATTKLSADKIAAWLTPAEALKRVTAAVGSEYVAANAIVTRLTDGFLIAAGNRVVAGDGPGAARAVNRTVESDWWKSLHGDGHDHRFWKTGHVELWRDDIRISFHGLRFDPDGITAMLFDIGASAVPPESPQAQVQRESPKDEPEKPRVSDANLRGWHELYCRVYGLQRPLNHAWESARGMFPDKSVSRESVRDLFEPRRAGRKPKGSAN